MFRVKNRDKQPQFFDKHFSKTRKIQFRILMRSDALWYSDHSSSGDTVKATGEQFRSHEEDHYKAYVEYLRSKL